MKDLTRFRRWADQRRRRRGLLCHFYEGVSERQKQYYTKVDYAYFNLFSESPDWIIKGTTSHGITSQRDRTSMVPCLNCYQVNEKFYCALEEHCGQSKRKYEFGIVLSKSELKRYFGEENVVDVGLWDHHQQRPQPSECWRYDIATARRSLIPFNYCDIVRIRIAKSSVYGIPISTIPRSTVMGLLLRQQGCNLSAIERRLRKKTWDEVEIFTLL